MGERMPSSNNPPNAPVQKVNVELNDPGVKRAIAGSKVLLAHCLVFSAIPPTLSTTLIKILNFLGEGGGKGVRG